MVLGGDIEAECHDGCMNRCISICTRTCICLLGRFSLAGAWMQLCHYALINQYNLTAISYRYIGNRLFYFLIIYTKTHQKSKINFPQFLLCVYVCVFVCLLALYRSHRLTYGANFFTTISVNTHLDAETIIL